MLFELKRLRILMQTIAYATACKYRFWRIRNILVTLGCFNN